MCATEKRRQIKRGKLAASQRFAYINQALCDDCGDCSRQSNCLAIGPVQTRAGRKRKIDQAACNHDMSCLAGHCPSIVSIKGKRKRRDNTLLKVDISQLPRPTLPALDQPYQMVIAGVGGTGIVTLSAILGVAAHLDDKAVSVLDMTGLAQKFGAVYSHIQFAGQADNLYAPRIAAGRANLLLGCDALAACSEDVLAKLDPDHSRSVINQHPAVSSEYLKNPQTPFSADELTDLIQSSVVNGQSWFVNSTDLAEHYCGNPIAGNMLLTGYAWQRGLIPLSESAIKQAIQINGVAAEMNIQAFDLGRALAAGKIELPAKPTLPDRDLTSLDELTRMATEDLQAYQNAALAQRYQERIEVVREREQQQTGDDSISRLLAVEYARLLANKDEYEVAQQLTSKAFKIQLDREFEPGYKIHYHLAPPLPGSKDDIDKNPPKKKFGPWLRPVLKTLATVRPLRNSVLDPFSYSTERRSAARLISELESFIDRLQQHLNDQNHAQMLALLQSLEQVRGYGVTRQQAAYGCAEKLQKSLKQ